RWLEWFFSQSGFWCRQCKRRGGVAAEQANELGPLHLDDSKPKDHAEYSRSKPCIAAKAGRSCPVGVRLGHLGVSVQMSGLPEGGQAGRFMSTRPRGKELSTSSHPCIPLRPRLAGPLF